ncbi:sensor histidine kinase, putative [Caenispirillum salinarum AK4]|uniref:histidine kinase n=1 Tax=Caenispirillum salinarum AK4 TaxID=1238182 RepID=K9GXK7_9PROT|nr:sensor histidine kinase [Caenispirillum salinarum]EKV30700.1 sensor histidine kinase, putative [Caenispirillum salinarum AK4]
MTGDLPGPDAATGPPDAGTAVVLAPFGGDAAILVEALQAAGVPVRRGDANGALPTAPKAIKALHPGILLLTEEALGPAVVAALAGFQAAEPQWSAPPVILLCSTGTDVRRLTAPLLSRRPDTPLTVLRRPTTEADLLTAVRSARRVRAVQLRTRDVLEERERSEQWARFLLNELSHRTKNMFSMVLALARQTMRQTPQTPEAFMKTFEGRVHTLAEAYSALTRNDWQAATVGDLAEHVVLPLAEDDGSRGRVTLAGPVLAVPPATATTLALAMHELATNATKYGALSTTGGTVRITWSRTPGGLGRLEWRERDGPPVTPPTHMGFGTRVITGAIKTEAGGDADMRFEPEGLTCILTFQTSRTS